MLSKSTNRASCSRSSSSQSKKDARVVAQSTIDAKLHVDFEESKRLFDYSTSIDFNISSSTSNVSSSTVKNAPEMLELSPYAVPSIKQQEALTFGTDVRMLFQSQGAAALQKAVSVREVNLLNPISVHCKTSGKPFYAILHTIDAGLVIDLEPVNPADVPVTAAGALKSYKLAAKAISRVMVYKFHEDEHGEVVAECHRPDLEPYLGLHYPATDIPQASRFLFMKNKVSMICDCFAQPVTPQNPISRRDRRRALVRRVPQMHKAWNLSYHTLIPSKSEDQIFKIYSDIINLQIQDHDSYLKFISNYNMASLLTRHFSWFPRPRFHFLKWWTRKNYEINSVSKYEVPLIKLKACQQVQARKQIQYGHEIDVSSIGHGQCIIPTNRATICWCITPTSWVERTDSFTNMSTCASVYNLPH
ncbi:hypothetical protein SLEP1_g27728 [Rubroshorea leprosula]|uniref:Phytochrome chromophore attachment site domain-containing protein n=1 Tax=Rubroshorea leprosula TaxID=152421 RepID=A0AAV5K023_9ROSI|nr:hypothetical protein SLEP1_g27728 [Rubroshorea leprosula]